MELKQKKQKKKITIIKKPKVLKLKTPEQMFKFLFHNQINMDFLTKYNVKPFTMIDTNSSTGQDILKDGKQLLKEILKDYNISDIHTNTYIKTPINTLGIININNIGNKKNIYFKHYTPKSYSLFYNILATFNESMLQKLDTEIYTKQLGIYGSTILKDKDAVLDFIGNPIKDTISKSLNKIIANCKSISKWLNKSIVIFQDSIPDSSFAEIINCTHPSVNTLTNDIIIIYVNYNKQFDFEPVVHINVDIRGKINYIINNTPGEEVQKTHIYNLLEKVKEAKSVVNVVSKKIKVIKPKPKTTYVEFNPYDKNQELPIIEINITESVKKTFLLGHEINSYHNIYDDVETNDLAGRIKFNSDNTANVDWCEGFPNK